MLYHEEDRDGMIPLVSTVDEGTWNFSPTKATQTGKFHFTKGNWSILGRGNVAVHYIVNFHTYYVAQSHIHKSNPLILCFLTLSKSFQDPASQIPWPLQRFSHLYVTNCLENKKTWQINPEYQGIAYSLITNIRVMLNGIYRNLEGLRK